MCNLIRSVYVRCQFFVGVYLCKHADVIAPEPLKSIQFGTLVVFKVIKVTCDIFIAVVMPV